DHYVYPKYQLGNLMNQDLGAMARSPKQIKFGSDKLDLLPRFCRECDVRFACNGECPKHRFARTPDGEGGLDSPSPACKKFFRHSDPYMKTMAQWRHHGRAPAEIMGMISLLGFEDVDALLLSFLNQRHADQANVIGKMAFAGKSGRGGYPCAEKS